MYSSQKIELIKNKKTTVHRPLTHQPTRDHKHNPPPSLFFLTFSLPVSVLCGALRHSVAPHSYSAITTIMLTPNSRARISMTDWPKLERPTRSSGSTVTVAM